MRRVWLVVTMWLGSAFIAMLSGYIYTQLTNPAALLDAQSGLLFAFGVSFGGLLGFPLAATVLWMVKKKPSFWKVMMWTTGCYAAGLVLLSLVMDVMRGEFPPTLAAVETFRQLILISPALWAGLLVGPFREWWGVLARDLFYLAPFILLLSLLYFRHPTKR